MERYKVVCCMCGVAVMMKPGNTNGKVSHGFCQTCFDIYCLENGLEPVEIFVPDGSIVNEEAIKRSN